MEAFGWVMFFALCGAGIVLVLALVNSVYDTRRRLDDLEKVVYAFRERYWDREAKRETELKIIRDKITRSTE